jgi:hypothetical protein
MMECPVYYNAFPINTGDPESSALDHTVMAASDTAIPEFGCPSNPNSRYGNEDGAFGSKYALTNYKGMGATCMSSLMMCLTPGATEVAAGAPGSVPAKHPDGAIFPGKALKCGKVLKDIDFKDGTDNTIMCTETIDNVGKTSTRTGSRWLCATDVILVGLPTGTLPPGCTGAVTFNVYGPAQGGYWAPTDYEPGKYGRLASTSATYKTFRTYLEFNFAKSPDAGSYPALPYTPLPNQPDYGPSSGHPAVVNHLFVSGKVRSLAKNIDVSVYMFMITRANSDPWIVDPL